MTYKLFISDTKEGFEPQKSLIDRPAGFDVGYIKGCYFYLSYCGKLGGDTFTVKADQGVAVCLLGDVCGHGSLDRHKLRLYTSELEKVTDKISAAKFDEKAVISELLGIDKKITDPDFQMAFSLMRILPDGTFYYLNGGENIIMGYQNGNATDLSERFVGKVPKIGAIGFFLGSEAQILRDLKLKFHKDKLSSGDKILIFSDGVTEFSQTRNRQKEDLKQERLLEIKGQLASGQPLECIIQEMNMSAQAQLVGFREGLADDYTIVGLERT